MGLTLPLKLKRADPMLSDPNPAPASTSHCHRSLFSPSFISMTTFQSPIHPACGVGNCTWGSFQTSATHPPPKCPRIRPKSNKMTRFGAFRTTQRRDGTLELYHLCKGLFTTHMTHKHPICFSPCPPFLT